MSLVDTVSGLVVLSFTIKMMGSAYIYMLFEKVRFKKATKLALALKNEHGAKKKETMYQ